MALMNPRARNIGRLIFGGALFIGALVFFFINLRWFLSVLAGPQPITVEDLAKLESPSSLSNPWVSVTATATLSTGQLLYSDKGEELVAAILLLKVHDRWLVAEVPPDQRGKTYTGYLTAYNPTWAREKMENVKKQIPPRGELLPFELDGAYDYKGKCYLRLGIAGGLGLLGLLMGCTGGIQLLRHSEPVTKKKRAKEAPPDDEEPKPRRDKGAISDKKKKKVAKTTAKEPSPDDEEPKPRRDTGAISNKKKKKPDHS